MHDKGRPEFVLKFVTVTPFRKHLGTKIGSVHGGVAPGVFGARSAMRALLSMTHLL